MPDIKQAQEKDSVPFYPDHVSTELRVMGGILAIVLVIGAVGLFFPVGLGVPADPLDTPLHIKPEWYFLSLYQLLKYIPKTTGAVAPVLLLLLLAFWPFIDRKPDRDRKIQKIRFVAVAIIMLVLTALTIWGEVS